MSNIPNELQSILSDDRTASPSSDRTASSRMFSAKRPRDASQRKNVSFNDIPIVHEVPPMDTTRTSTYESYRSWTFTDATPPIALVSPFASSQVPSPFNSNSVTVQRLITQRLGSASYSSTNTATSSRLPDWVTRARLARAFNEDLAEQSNHSHTSSTTSSLIDERVIKHSSTNQQSSSENGEERKHPYRSPVIPDAEHYRSLPFSSVQLSDSASTYNSILATHQNSSHSGADQTTPVHTPRSARSRSAAVPLTVTHSALRHIDNVSVSSIQTNPQTTTAPNHVLTVSPLRSVLKPSTISFQYSSTTITPYPYPALVVTSSPNTKSAQATPRLNSSTMYSRLHSSVCRPQSSSNKSLNSHSTTESIQKLPLTALPRSRSANVVTTKCNIISPVLTLDGQSGGTNHTNIYATTKRNPNMRHTYGSHYMHRVPLPSNIN